MRARRWPISEHIMRFLPRYYHGTAGVLVGCGGGGTAAAGR
ncbi:hypothetical protein HMPREF0742_01338 [Rothia aeria F0184]|uniref:Uncharacterized protein n=1 Tax=Rothia aeria F0184 TaxID=888019 RepID=U7V485_9MICC|nr:hypothetical protein HMPREF0742_01338 [Rothia aeria F0184]